MTADKLMICEKLMRFGPAYTKGHPDAPDGMTTFLPRINPDGPEAAAIIEGLVEALDAAREDVLSGRDYANDAFSGGLVYDTGERVSPKMTAADMARMTGTVERIDAALAKVRTPHRPDEGGQS